MKYIGIVDYHKPYILLLENVKNILTIDSGNVGKTIESKLDELGYILHKNILNASYFGIPQARERVYFVALRKDMKTSNKRALDYNTPKANRKNIFLEDILETNVWMQISL
ncbi:hypothetical protein AGMMS5026_06880 [Endomicrobiia bacterium]|nr:hypothetical protein AGMMS49523_02960 [Endomicrobiia bacterium]GHT12088.1 hypothetical protein AGMMS49571_03470 [Endomicrobiia bacterium]GHT20997.1 hypothetical protein AGMMS49929_08900 [Endomicrobiia bacterium]GHT26055.1 hypothetical protein AGMMS49995_01770 [Endomicrobiia bacterium]GHT31090.1 hypothetical protein AGMMS5026_06880 [Endomicrobiia bacterium]